MSFSVVNNVSAANAQANLSDHQHRPEQGPQPVVERSPHQQLGRRRGGPRRGEQPTVRTSAVLNQGIRNAGDGLSTLQIKDGALNNISNAARSSLDPGDAVGVVELRASTAPRWTPSSRTCSAEIDREASVAGLDATAGLLGVRQQRQHATARSAARSARPTRRASASTGLTVDTARQRGGRGRGAGRRRSRPSARSRRRSEPSRTVCSTPSSWRSRRS